MSNISRPETTCPTLPARSEDGERVARLLRATSRTFALSIEGLPGSLREEMALAYLLFRVSDYFEDHPELSPDEKAELLALWEQTLANPERAGALTRRMADVPYDRSDPEADVAREFELLFRVLSSFDHRVQAVIVERVRETTRGMARWQLKGPRVEDEDELDDYMHHVAGLVGYLVTDLFALHFPRIAERRTRLMPLAREFGLALQCVNILRGLRKDYERGWIFVPRTLCAEHGLVTTDLFRPATEHRAMQVVRDLAEKAERHLRNGLRYVTLIPRSLHRLRLACMWPLLFAARTIAVTRENPAVLRGEAKITRDTVASIVRHTMVLGWSNSWLSAYANRLLASERLAE
ncbi:MAG: squalene/phytoene synthase family protein [Spirochaetota bacterium]